MYGVTYYILITEKRIRWTDGVDDDLRGSRKEDSWFSLMNPHVIGTLNGTYAGRFPENGVQKPAGSGPRSASPPMRYPFDGVNNGQNNNSIHIPSICSSNEPCRTYWTDGSVWMLDVYWGITIEDPQDY